MTTITVHTPTKVGTPRFALMAANAAVQVLSWIEQFRAARAERRAMNARLAEAAAVRRYALQFTAHDPRFVADLLAAADRHELNG